MPKRDVLLVGSVPLASADAVFALCAEVLGDRLKRIPDGETGARTNWIAWQRPALERHPALAAGQGSLYRIKPGYQGEIAFQPFGYAAAAQESYATFKALRAAGRIPSGTRFQVALPTPLAAMALYFDAASQARLEPAYTRTLLDEADAVARAIPAADLAMQWDVAVEFAVLEGVRPVHFSPAFQGVIDRLVAALGHVPAGVECGLHLCYGDAGHKHFVEPKDAALMVQVANALAERTPRPIDYLHLPVPRERDDDAYFKPLAALRMRPGTKLFLGVVHATDGVDGARRRMIAAGRYVQGFGIATECGFGRRPAESIPDLLDLHRQLAAA